MIWQEIIFLVGSVFSIVSLAPTLRSSAASVPLATSLPSATLGFVYGVAFLTLGMNFSAVGSLMAGLMWSLIMILRRPAQPERRGERTLSDALAQLTPN